MPSPRSRSSRQPRLPTTITRALRAAATSAEQAAERAVAEDHHRLAGFRRAPARSRPARRPAARRTRRARRPWRRRSRTRLIVDQARRQRDELAVGAVDEQQVLAEIRAAGPAERAGPHGAELAATARSPSRTPRTPAPTAATVPANSWPKTVGTRGIITGMAAAQRLHVGAARQRRLDPEHDLAGPRLGHRHLLVAQIAGAVKDHRAHRAHGVT